MLKEKHCQGYVKNYIERLFILLKNSFCWSWYLDIYMSAMKIKSYQGVRFDFVEIFQTIFWFFLL